MLNVRVDNRRALERIGNMMNNARDMSTAMRLVAVKLWREQMRHFSTQVNSDGGYWMPSQRALKQSGQTLQDTGRLKQSITWSSDDFSADVFDNVEYGIYHQNGTGRKKREFLYIDDATKESLLASLGKYLLGEGFRA